LSYPSISEDFAILACVSLTQCQQLLPSSNSGLQYSVLPQNVAIEHLSSKNAVPVCDGQTDRHADDR